MIPTDKHVPESVLTNALARARTLIETAQTTNSRHERATRRGLARLFQDDDAIKVTITLTDEVMRFRSPRSAVRALKSAVSSASSKGFGLVNVVGLRGVAYVATFVPTLALRIVHARIRDLTSTMILDDDPASLSSQFSTRQREGLRVNVNVLGEAVLGEREADHRLERVLEMVRRPDVNYVSVKLSAIVSQLQTIDHVGSLERVGTKLRTLYRVAQRENTFINLDMEEYRDLRLTLDAFRNVLSEPEFTGLDAGIVLQAYLPESHHALETLLDFSQRRHEAGGGCIKVRLVKGANLAMERVESELHGWTPAPYTTKADVDASYCRLLDVALRPEHASSLRVGVASHNLFHVAWALELAQCRAVTTQLDVEMLEGMANAEARALVASGQSVLLYAPVTRRDDFASAVAYLVRRLDENTSLENYLRAALFIANDVNIYNEQRDRFVTALNARHSIGVNTLRTSVRLNNERFSNEPDGDPTNEVYVREVTHALDVVCTSEHEEIDTLARLRAREHREYEAGRDPSDHAREWYRYRVATNDEIDEALEFASAGFAAWHATPLNERVVVLDRAAGLMAQRRATTLAVMARDGGKTISEADPEVSEAVDFVRYYARHARDETNSNPLGVVLVVAPWNFPYAIPAGGVAAALAAGSAVILKPAPETVAVAYELVRQLWDAGVPRDVLQLVPTRDDESGRHLITHVGVSAVVLTGSFETARLFTSWKPALYLLGETSGKNAITVTASADIDLAVKDIVQSAFGHAGQKCSAASLAIVQRATYDDPNFLHQLVDSVSTLRVGPSYELATNVGPLIRPPEPALLRALHQLDEGESWLIEPRQLDDEGLLWRPGVKIGVRPGSWS
ncbi:MAG: proline dehydrogenase family protein, partial [Acidimicrobiales bacterium]